jgi:hypothetical protein
MINSLNFKPVLMQVLFMEIFTKLSHTIPKSLTSVTLLASLYAVPWLMHSTPPPKPGGRLRSFHVEFVVDNVGQGERFIRVFRVVIF